MEERWPGWCLECGNNNTLSCDDCGWGQMVDGPDLWVPKRQSNRRAELELEVAVEAIRNLRVALERLERAIVGQG